MIPQHIVEDYPRFVDFLTAYYQWLEEEGNPYSQLRSHMDYLSFSESLESYVDMMKREYLHNIPKSTLADDEFLIKWSKKFNLSRGSTESFKFLFKILYDEQSVEIYNPKDNILKTSDGTWIPDQTAMLVTYSGDPNALLYKRIYQKREIFPGIYENASASVESYLFRYTGGFNILELILTDVKGEFKTGYKVFDDDGNYEWPIQTIVDFQITDGGSSYFSNDALTLSNLPSTFEETYYVTKSGELNTRLTTTLQKDQLEVVLNGSILDISDYEYDGQYVISPLFNNSDEVIIRFSNSYQGSYYVDEVDESGAIQNIGISNTPIAVSTDAQIDVNPDSSGFGSGLVATAIKGVTRKIPGYYSDNRGQLSSNMYIQDSNFYQNYSYVIKTEQNIDRYANIVRQLLHPAGFKMFGNVRIITIIEAIIGVEQDASGIYIQDKQIYSSAKYSAGNNYLWYAKNQDVMSPRVYTQPDITFDSSYVIGDDAYALEDESKEKEYDLNGNPVIVDTTGWMTKTKYADYDVKQPEDYFEHDNYDYLYMESSYVNTQDMDTAAFLDKYIQTYSAFAYYEEDYAE